MAAADRLLGAGLLVPAIRPPTVPTRHVPAPGLAVRGPRPGGRAPTGEGSGRPVTRPSWVVVITGTGTEVGKTFVAAGLLAELRRRGFAGGGPQAGPVLLTR